MKINKKEFIKILEFVKPGLANKDIIEFTNTFSFTKENLITFNDEICIKYPLETEFKGTVIADEFFKLINKTEEDKEGNIVINQKENELIIKGKKSIAGIVFNTMGKLPLDELVKEPSKLYKIPNNFLEGIYLSLFCVSHDESTPLITCLNVQKEFIESTNGYRFFRYLLSKPIKTTFLLSSKCASVISKYNIIKYSIENNWAYFLTKENVLLHSRIYQEETFPCTDQFFNTNGKKIFFSKEVPLIIDKAIIFCSEQDSENLLQVNIEKDKITISSKKEGIGWFKETCKQKNKQEVQFEINAFFLRDLLKKTNTCFMVDKNNLLGFKTDKFEHIIRYQK